MKSILRNGIVAALQHTVRETEIIQCMVDESSGIPLLPIVSKNSKPSALRKPLASRQGQMSPVEAFLRRSLSPRDSFELNMLSRETRNSLRSQASPAVSPKSCLKSTPPMSSSASPMSPSTPPMSSSAPPMSPRISHVISPRRWQAASPQSSPRASDLVSPRSLPSSRASPSRRTSPRDLFLASHRSSVDLKRSPRRPSLLMSNICDSRNHLIANECDSLKRQGSTKDSPDRKRRSSIENVDVSNLEPLFEASGTELAENQHKSNLHKGETEEFESEQDVRRQEKLTEPKLLQSILKTSSSQSDFL